MMRNDTQQDKSFRLFFALWPSENVRQALFSASGKLKSPINGLQVEPNNLHMTLHFIGNVSESVMQCLQTRAGAVNFQPFTLKVEQFGSFTGPKVVWLGCRDIPEPLKQLQIELGKVLMPCGFSPENRSYRPHVTLYRKARLQETRMLEEPVIWQVEQFALIHSTHRENRVYYNPVKFYDVNQ